MKVKDTKEIKQSVLHILDLVDEDDATGIKKTSLYKLIESRIMKICLHEFDDLKFMIPVVVKEMIQDEFIKVTKIGRTHMITINRPCFFGD